MKLTLIYALARTQSVAVPSGAMAQVQAQDRDQLQDCGSLGDKDCAAESGNAGGAGKN